MNGDTPPVDDLSDRLRKEAREAEKSEPELSTLLRRTVLAKGVVTFEDAVAMTVCHRMLGAPYDNTARISAHEQPTFCPHFLRSILDSAMASPDLELGHTMKDAVREDVLAICRRDPAAETLLEVVLFYKGFAALVCHRAARRKWFAANGKRSFTALFLQSQASAVFGVDIHPAAAMGAGILLDHGTGIVIGETATVGDGCTMLHGVTLGGTGKVHGDRHPKIGKNVLIGAGASILGNLRVGDGAKIGAGSIVLRPIPAGATAVGSPAKIIGHATESNPGSDVDVTLEGVSLLHKSESAATVTTAAASETDDSDNDDYTGDGNCVCPFREYTYMAKNAPPGTVTIVTVGNLLCPEGCTKAEVGEVFFALDTKNVGYVHMDVFRLKCPELIEQYTSINPDRVVSLLSSFLE